MPIFVKEGAIIPKYPIQQYVGEKEIDLVSLSVYFKNGSEESHLYEDAQDGYDYTKGRYSLRHFKLNGASDKLTIRQHKLGKYKTNYEFFELSIYGLPFELKNLTIDNEKVEIKDYIVDGKKLKIPKSFVSLVLS